MYNHKQVVKIARELRSKVNSGQAQFSNNNDIDLTGGNNFGSNNDINLTGSNYGSGNMGGGYGNGNMGGGFDDGFNLCQVLKK